MKSGREGFSLVELLVALVMLGIVGNAIIVLMIGMQRITRQQGELAAMQGSLRSGFQLLQGELVELAPGDLTDIAGDRLGYRAMRGLGETCDLDATMMKVRRSSYAGLRPPTPGRDGLWLYLEGDSTIASDDRWLALGLGGISAATCPDGTDAWALDAALEPDELAQALVPGPMRTFEEMEIGQVQEDGLEWLGIRSEGLGEASLAPVSGPVTWNGVRFTYLDMNDAPTATAPDVTTIVVMLRGVSERPVGVGAAGILRVTDSLELRVRLRN